MGFCLFSNVASAADLAIRDLGAERVLIIDWDVHPGNGPRRSSAGALTCCSRAFINLGCSRGPAK
jgi:hypothetical protein